jgi:hypothetical protein
MIGTSEEVRIQEGYRKVNMVEILCTDVWKWKMRPVETIPGMEGREDEGE